VTDEAELCWPEDWSARCDHRVAVSVDDIDEALEIAARHRCHPLRGVATYDDIYELTHLRGPSGILVMLAQELKES
jgi:glyoxylase I family protein